MTRNTITIELTIHTEDADEVKEKASIHTEDVEEAHFMEEAHSVEEARHVKDTKETEDFSRRSVTSVTN
jgi:hypothetical protein